MGFVDGLVARVFSRLTKVVMIDAGVAIVQKGFYHLCHGGVVSIYCSKTVNHRLTGPGKMVKLCLLFMGIQRQNEIDIPVTLNYCS